MTAGTLLFPYRQNKDGRRDFTAVSGTQRW